MEGKFKRALPYLLIILISIILINAQILNRTTITTVDTYFHYSRFFDAAQQIRTGNISFFQMNWAFDQSGRIVNAFYGPIFAYLMGSILLITKNWFNFQILTSLIISIITGVGIYGCLKKYWPNNNFSNAIISCLYLAQINPWSNGTTFITISRMLIPLALFLGLRMVYNHQEPINVFQMAIFMAIVMQIHILSTLLFGLLLVPFTIYGFLHAENKHIMLLNLIYAILLFLVLTVNIWGPIIYFQINDNLSSPIPFDMQKGVFKLSSLNIFQLLIGLFQLILAICFFKDSKINTFLTSYILMLLFISSRFFPWNFIQKQFPFLKQGFQFPHRLSILIFGLTMVCLAMTIDQLKRKNIKSVYLILISIICLGALTSIKKVNNGINSQIQFSRQPKGRLLQEYAQNSSSLKLFLNEYSNFVSYDINKFSQWSQFTPEYLPIKKGTSYVNIGKLYKEKVFDQKKYYKHDVKSNAQLQLSWRTNRKELSELPIIMYKDSSLVVNGKKLKIYKNSIGNPTVMSIKGKNSAVLSYDVPKIICLEFIFSICGWIFVIYEVVKKYVKYKVIKKQN